MKKYIALVFAIFCILSLIGCNQQSATNKNIQTNSVTEHEENTGLKIVEPDDAIESFSYAADKEKLAEGEPGVKTSGFVNTTETEITSENVAEHAGNECNIEYDSVKIYLDTAERVWKVHFYTNGILGGDESVYLDHNGKTVLIVYGE